MALHLLIENETSLPDGGPLGMTVSGPRGIDIGRDPGVDWTLPDPTRTISGRHCEIRLEGGEYWLRDVSRNGTFLNRSSQRMQEPARLRHGDRIEIGRYVVAVSLEAEPAARPAAGPGQDLWAPTGESAPPIAARDLRPPRELKPVQADFSEWAVDVPAADMPPAYAPQAAPAPPPFPSADAMDWAQAAAPPIPSLPPAIPAPRRAAPLPAGQDPWGSPEDVHAPPLPAGPSAPPVPQNAPALDIPPLPASAEASLWSDPPSRSDAGRAAPDPASAWGVPSLAPLPAPAAMPPQPRPREPAPSPPPAFDQAPAPQPSIPAAPPGPAAAPSELIRRFAAGAGVPVETLAWRDPGDFAEECGALVRMAAENLKQLLAARAETKRVAKTGSQTMIQALDNNPLKFSPTIDDALRIMFGRPSSGYLDARRAMEGGFKDLKTHQVKTYSAMQHALRLLMSELDPDAIMHAATDGDRGLGGLLGSKKAKLWDVFCARWDAMTAPHEEGMVDAFLVFFAECYDRGADKGR